MATRQTRTLARTMMAPAVLVLFIWMIVPLVMTVWFSFHRYDLQNLDTYDWSGWENYYFFLTDPAFIQALIVTLTLVASVPAKATA